MEPQQIEQIQNAPSPVATAIIGLVGLGICIFFIACLWRLFTKAGEPGWASIVPIYNIFVMLKIAGKPGWWFILLCIPGVNFIISILVGISLAERFGKTAGFGIGLALLGFIFLPILAFGDAQYLGEKSA